MTFPQYPQYPQRPQQPHPQQNPQQPSQYQQQPQYPQPQANPYELWLRRVKSVFSRIGAGMCLMVVIWYALATVLSGMLYQVLHTTNLPNWAVYVASDTPLYLVAMPLAVLIMGKSSVIETRKFDMKPGQFFKLLVMCFPLMYVGSLIGNMLAALLSGGKASNSVSDLAMQFDVWNVVFLVILGPLFEEWIFRKELISRTRKYGEKNRDRVLRAVLCSGAHEPVPVLLRIRIGSYVRLRVRAHQQTALFGGHAHDRQLHGWRGCAVGGDEH